MEQRNVPGPGDDLRPNAQELQPDHLAHMAKVPIQPHQHVEYLLLSGGDAVRDQVADLQMREELLTWRAIVGIWASEQDRNTEEPQCLEVVVRVI